MAQKVARCSGTRKGHDVMQMTRLEPLAPCCKDAIRTCRGGKKKGGKEELVKSYLTAN